MKKILVPTDFSKNAYAALFYVSKLFGSEALQITLVHSFGDEISTLTSRVDIGRSEGIVDKLYAQSEDDGKKFMHTIKLDLGDLPHTYDIISTPAQLPRLINTMIAEEGFDLVVMGSKGRTGAEAVLMGSTTLKVIQKLEGCPLLIVPKEVDFKVPSSIAFATDFNEFYQLSKLKPLLQLVRHYNSTLHVTHVGEAELNEEQRHNIEQFKNDLIEFNSEIHWLQKKENISNTLHTFIDDKNIDLLALVYHKHNFIDTLFREPVVKRMGKNTHTPTLVIPIK
ncbi:MAG: universal stress protein [Altibacter sp.]|nr:universal stress protein [Altibacter sp.]